MPAKAGSVVGLVCFMMFCYYQYRKLTSSFIKKQRNADGATLVARSFLVIPAVAVFFCVVGVSGILWAIFIKKAGGYNYQNKLQRRP